jgi:hypothetical protein
MFYHVTDTAIAVGLLTVTVAIIPNPPSHGMFGVSWKLINSAFVTLGALLLAGIIPL